jgi:hypothetical protein
MAEEESEFTFNEEDNDEGLSDGAADDSSALLDESAEVDGSAANNGDAGVEDPVSLLC